MTYSNNARTIAFFGATGGTVGASLACALREGYHCTALVRTPSKLRTFLVTEHGIDVETLTKHLTIIQGDAKDPASLAPALISPTKSNNIVDIIYTGIGAYPVFQWSLWQPFVLADPHICESGMAAIYTALDTLSQKDGISETSEGCKPLLIALSSTGVNGKTPDVPWVLQGLYHYLGRSPHADKRRMEDLVLGDGGAHIRDFVIVRPALLSDGAPRGNEAVRAGWEWGVGDDKDVDEKREQAPGPAVGYYVSRKDVGRWVFGKVCFEGGWEGRCVSLTY